MNGKKQKEPPEIVINNTGAFDSLVSGLNNDALNGIEIERYGTNGKITGQVLNEMFQVEILQVI